MNINDEFLELANITVYEHQVLLDKLSELQNFLPDEIEIVNENGDVIAVAIREYDPGSPDVHYLPNGDPGYPGDPGYDFYRFATLKELQDREVSI